MKLGLAFSGGKDSLACLLLNKHRADEITCFWANTGKTYPETLEIIDIARKTFKFFVEVQTDRETQNAKFGIPSDVVPINWTNLGQAITSPKPYLIQSYLNCCNDNISYPMHQAVKAYQITHLIRGQRREESHRAVAVNGSEYDGITYLHPIETWSEAQVLEYIESHMPIPKHFSVHHSSLDCYDCTAFRKQSVDRIEYTQRHHPDLYQKYKIRNDALMAALKEEL